MQDVEKYTSVTKIIGKNGIYGFQMLEYFPQLKKGETYMLQHGRENKKYIESTNNELKVSLEDCLLFPHFFKPLYVTSETTKYVIIDSSNNRIYSGDKHGGWGPDLTDSILFDTYVDAENCIMCDTGDDSEDLGLTKIFGLVSYSDLEIIEVKTNYRVNTPD